MRGRSVDERTPAIGRDATAASLIRHLGILVVYHLKDDDDLPLLELHLERVARHTAVPYTLFAVANRVSAAARDLIRRQRNVVLCDISPTEARGSREHGYYLDAMLPVALAAGVSHVCTLDVDSFPIDDRWLDVVVAKMPESGVVGVLRSENGDVALAHPSCIFAPREFFTRHAPSFSPDPEDTKAYRKFLRATGQAPDTGIRLASALWNAGETWGALSRTNAVDPHYLLGGIYDDVLFHLGGIARGNLFRGDLRQSRPHRLSRPLERLPARGTLLTGWKQRSLTKLRGGAERRLAGQNREVYYRLRAWLYRDPDALFGYLRGERDAAEWAAATGGPAVGLLADAAPVPAGAPETNGAALQPDRDRAPGHHGHDDVVVFPVPVVAEAPPPELRYRRALEVGVAARKLWASRRIVWALLVRQVRAQYSQQVLGLAWAILTPLAQTVLFTVLLNRVGNRAGINTGGVPKELFLYVSLTAWNFFSSSVATGGTSLVGNPLLNKVYAPREVFPLAQVSSSGVNAIAATMVFPLLMLVTGRGPSDTVYWIPLLLAALAAFTVAIALVVSAITVYLRDLRSGLPLLLQLAMFFPGVLYPVRLAVPAGLRGAYAAVLPVGTIVDQIRTTMFHSRSPSAGVTIIAAISSLGYLMVAFVFFKRLETGFADVS